MASNASLLQKGWCKVSYQINLDQKSQEILYLCKKDKRLAKLISMVGPIAYTLHDDSFSFLVHEIIEQMLSKQAGQKIYSRLERLCDGEVSPEKIALLTDDEIKSTGTAWSKVRFIRSLVEAADNGNIDPRNYRNLTDDEAIRELTSIHGIGIWTAKMFLIFILDRPNVLPIEDAAFLQVYKWLYKTSDCTPESIRKRCKKWSPYATTASRYFYRALDTGITKKPFHLFKDI